MLLLLGALVDQPVENPLIIFYLCHCEYVSMLTLALSWKHC